MTDLRSAIESVVTRASEVMVRNSGEELLENTQSLAGERVGTISGEYHSSFRLEISKFKAEVVNDAEHSGIVEAGSSPHQIFPRNASALRIEPPIQVGNRRITALSSVNHPGTQPNWVMRDALRQTVRNLFG